MGLWISLAALAVVSVVATFYALKFALIITRMEESVEAALDELDSSYAAIGRILERPLFFDSAEVRSVLNELGRAQNTILKVAQDMSADLQQIQEEAEE